HAQLEVRPNNNVIIGSPGTSYARLTIDPQYSSPGNKNLVIGDWYSSNSCLSIGVNSGYSWMQSWNVTPLYLNKQGNDVLITTGNWGGVGIGYNVTDPSAKLHVNGSIYVTGTITTSSDKRLKKNIEKLKHDKVKFKGIEAKEYNFNGNDKKFGIADSDTSKMKKLDRLFFEHKHYGFLAQDVQKVYPELVYEDDDGYLSIDYQGFVAILYEAVKAQQAEIESQNKRLIELEDQNKQLSEIEKRLAKLEQKLK
nr:tail fiber domain-containing protein [Prolixibacteraceae bacterium]